KLGGCGYAVSGGLHGVGVSVVNALSHRLEVGVHRGGYVHRQDYGDGVPTAPLAKGEVTDRTGTSITFWPNGDIFETTDFDFETLRSRFQQMAFLNKGLQITLTDERPEHTGTEDEVTASEPARTHVSNEPGKDGVTAQVATQPEATTSASGGPARRVTYK